MQQKLSAYYWQPGIDCYYKVNSCYNVVVVGTQVGCLWPALNTEVMAGRVWGICFYFYGNTSHIWVNPCVRLVTLGFLTKASCVRPTFTTIHLMFSLPPFCASVITRVFTQRAIVSLRVLYFTLYFKVLYIVVFIKHSRILLFTDAGGGFYW